MFDRRRQPTLPDDIFNQFAQIFGVFDPALIRPHNQTVKIFVFEQRQSFNQQMLAFPVGQPADKQQNGFVFRNVIFFNGFDNPLLRNRIRIKLFNIHTAVNQPDFSFGDFIVAEDMLLICSEMAITRSPYVIMRLYSF